MRSAKRDFSCHVFRAILCSFVIASSTVAFAGLPLRPIADFDGDGKADISVFRRSDQHWYIQKSTGGYNFVKWGNSTDFPAPADFTGDGKTDITVFRSILPRTDPDTGTWWVRDSTTLESYVTFWGSTWFAYADIAIPADYDGDGKADHACFWMSDAIGSEPTRFHILPSSGASPIVQDWGNLFFGDRPVPADYDGDGKADIAIYRNGEWWIRQSSNGAVRVEHFGLGSDRVVPGDFDGVGKGDLAVWRPSDGVWYIHSSQNGSVSYIQWGVGEDKPVPDDFDGDGKTDVAVFRPSTGVWYIVRSTDGNPEFHHFGLSDDVPIQNVYVR
jgi:hypothetical protein